MALALISVVKLLCSSHTHLLLPQEGGFLPVVTSDSTAVERRFQGASLNLQKVIKGSLQPQNSCCEAFFPGPSCDVSEALKREENGISHSLHLPTVTMSPKYSVSSILACSSLTLRELIVEPQVKIINLFWF